MEVDKIKFVHDELATKVRQIDFAKSVGKRFKKILGKVLLASRGIKIDSSQNTDRYKTEMFCPPDTTVLISGALKNKGER